MSTASSLYIRVLIFTRLKNKVFTYGERLVDRLDFEELALKSLDPSLGPKITSPRTVGKDIRQPQVRSSPSAPAPSLKLIPLLAQIPLIYPQHIITSPLLSLQTLVDKRAPRHKRGAWFWLLVSPLTAPFMLIRTSSQFARFRFLNMGAHSHHSKLTLFFLHLAKLAPL